MGLGVKSFTRREVLRVLLASRTVAGCRAVESLGRTYAKKLKIAHLQALVPGFQNYRETGFVFRRLRSTEDSHLLQREGVTQQYIAKKAQMR